MTTDQANPETKAIVAIERPTVSRRSFVELAVGAITMLPSVAGGFLLTYTPEKAYAEETTLPVTEIVIAKPNEMGIAVADVAGNKRMPVAGAAVTIKSNEGDGKIEGKTDDKGVFIVDLSKLVKPTKNAVGVDVYTLQASVTVEKEGYRSFETGWMSFKGGAGFDVPTLKIGDEVAYPKRVTLSDWDILYTNNEFAVTPANDETQEISIAFCTKTAGDITAEIVNVDTSQAVVTGKATAKREGSAEWQVTTVSMKGAYLLKGHKDALPIDKQFKLNYTIGGKSYSSALRLKLVDTPSAMTAPFTKKMSFGPFSEANMSLTVRLPKWVPLAGGQEVDIWKPNLPIDVCFDQYGYFRASLRTPEWGYKSKNGKVDGKAWKKLPRKSFAEQFDDAQKEMSSYAMKTAAYMVNGSRSTFSAFPAQKSLQLSFSAEAVVAGRWSDKSNAIRGKGQLRGVLTFMFSIAKQMFAGPVPFIIQFDLNMNAMIGVGCGVTIPWKAQDWGSWEYDYTSTGISFTLRIAPALSVGVGIKGVASVSLNGILAFTVYVGAGALPSGNANAKNPHTVLGLAAQVRIVIQLLFFTMPIDLWKYEKPKLYDSWDSKSLSAQADEDEEEEPPTFAEYFAENPPEEAEMNDWLAEFEGEGIIENLSAQSDDDPAAQRELVVEEFTTDDGMTYRIATFEEPSTAAARTVGAGDGAALMAGSSSILRAQADTPKDTTPTSKAGDYSALQQGHSYSLDKFENITGNIQIASEAGIKPGSKQCIAKNVLSDPRVKVISVYGKAVVFRIAAVKVDNKVRTRIVGQMLQTPEKPAGRLVVIEFDPNIYKDKGVKINRNDLYDYDFDVVCLTNLHQSYQSLQFFVVSGVREDGAKFGQVATDQVFEHVRIDIPKGWDGMNDWGHGSAHGFWARNYKFNTAESAKYAYHNFSCPHIQYVQDQDKSPGTGKLDRSNDEIFCTFLDRAATKPDLIMSDKTDDVRVSVGLCSTSTVASDYDSTKMLMFDLSEMSKGENQDPTVYELTCSKRLRKDYNSGYNIITLHGAKYSYHYRLLTSVIHVIDNLNVERTRILEAKLWQKSKTDDMISTDKTNDLLKLIDWPNHEGKFLAAVDGKLQSVEFTGLESGNPQPKYTEIGPKNFAIRSFGIDPTGTLLFYPTVSENLKRVNEQTKKEEETAGGYTYEVSKDGDLESKPVLGINNHRIMACRLRNGRFSDPFVFAEVNFDLDDLNVANVSNDSVGFLSTDVVDAQKAHADLYYTTVPFVKCANIIGCEAVSTFAYPNTEALFDLTVRNDGNTYITGLTAQLMQQGSTKVEATKKITFSAETLRESNYNPMENGKLKDVEDDYALAPGKTAVYRVGLTIPAGWEGRKKVCVKAVDVIVAPVTASASTSALKAAAAIAAQADGDGDDEYAIEFFDGDDQEAYAYDDTNAYEYVAGTNEDDYDDVYGEPYDIIDMLSTISFFDEDDYDDDIDRDAYNDGIDLIDGFDIDDNYHAQLYDPTIMDVVPDDGSGSDDDSSSDDSDDSGSTDDGSGSDSDGSSDGESTSGSGSSNSSGASGSKTSSTAASLAKTGDPLNALSGVFALTAAAGAAMVAYSKRRVENERAESESEE